MKSPGASGTSFAHMKSSRICKTNIALNIHRIKNAELNKIYVIIGRWHNGITITDKKQMENSFSIIPTLMWSWNIKWMNKYAQMKGNIMIFMITTLWFRNDRKQKKITAMQMEFSYSTLGTTFTDPNT